MENKQNLKKYLDRDIYSVEMVKGKKVVIAHGYFFTEGYEIVEGKPFREVDYSGAYVPLDEFITSGKEVIAEFLSSREDSYADLSEDEVTEVLNNFTGKPLPYDELTMDTPCGKYIDVKAEPQKLKKRRRQIPIIGRHSP